MRGVSTAERSGALRRAGAAAAIAATLAIGAAHARAWSFLCDDAFISFRYAEALARRGQLEFNPGERVEGFTNLLWVLLLAGGQALGVRPEALAPWLTTAASLAGLVLAAALLQRLLGGGRWRAWALTPALLLAATPEWIVWASGGLEGAVVAAFVLGAMLFCLKGQWVGSAIFGALAGLTRADALLPLGIFWAVQAVTAARATSGGRRGPPRRLVFAASCLLLPLLAQIALRRLYFGEWAPNTWHIKVHGALLRESHGGPYVAAWADALGLWALAPLGALLRLRHAAVAAPIVGVVVYAWAVGGDFMAYGRLLVVATGLMAVLVGWLLWDLGALAGRSWRPLGALPWVIGAALALGQATRAQRRWQADMATPSGWLEGRFEGARAMDRFAQHRLAVGAWMRKNLPEETWISVGAAGALPYASGLRAIDVFGLTEPALARLPGLEPRRGEGARPGHQIVAPLAYVRGRDPDLYCHLGHVGARPTAAAARRRGLGAEARWACVAVGGLVDRWSGETYDPGEYCCLRLRGRAVGPFRDDQAAGGDG
jgi:arabinofuranosyltransferase